MKTTVQIPGPLFRKAKAKAADPEWMQGFGKLRRLRNETERIQARIAVL